MKITAQLAFSQITLNRKRTLGSILAISLSTTLVTAVMCFATSGNKMLTDFLGEDYGSYRSAYFLLLAIPALLFALLISWMSISIISNIFTASANKRIQEFGILKCVGGTKKQIKESVIYESLWFSIISIPLGLLLGTLIGYMSVKIAGHYIDNINELSKSIIMRPFSFSLPFHVSVWTYVFAAAFSLFIVIRSASKPARTVGKLPAIACIKGLTGNQNLKNAVVKDGLLESFLGCECAIAWKNIKRNKAGYQATIRALSLGILLLLLTGGLAGQAKELEEWMNPNSKEINVDYCSIRDISEHPITGKREEKIVAPIPAQTYNEITEKLSAYPNTNVYGIGSDACTYHALLRSNDFSDALKQVPDILDENGEAAVSLMSVDNTLYEKLCNRAGVEYGSNLLLNTYEYNDNGRWKEIVPFHQNLREITLVDAANQQTQLPIDGFLTEKDLEETGFHEMLPNPVRIIVPNIDVRYFDWFCSPDNEEDFTRYARTILDEYYPILTDDSYVEQGYTVRIARFDQMTTVLNSAILLAEIVMYGFVLLLILMGFTSVINTLSTNLRIRSREFAILKSIGMTRASLRKMIYIESFICILKASFWGIALGIAIPFAINLSIRQAFPILYHIPWKALAVGIVSLMCAVMFLTYLEINRQNGKNIIDEIKMDVM